MLEGVFVYLKFYVYTVNDLKVQRLFPEYQNQVNSYFFMNDGGFLNYVFVESNSYFTHSHDFYDKTFS